MAMQGGIGALTDALAQQSKAEQAGADYGSRVPALRSSAETGPVVPRLQAGLLAADAVLGEEAGALLKAFLPVILPMASGLGLDLNSNIRLGYGGSEEAAQENARINSMLVGRQTMQLGAGGAAALAKAIGAIPGGQGIANWIQNLDPASTGTALTVLTGFMPELPAVISRFAPDMIVDYQPMIAALRVRNGGQVDERALDAMEQQVREVHRSGLFGPGVPVQHAISSLGFVTENVPGSDIMTAANYSRAADALVKNGLSDYGKALHLVHRMAPGAGDRLPQIVNSLAARARKAAVPAEMLAKAMESGEDPLLAMNAVITGSAVRNRLGGEAAGRASDAVLNFKSSPIARYLAAGSKLDRGFRQKVDQAIGRQDYQALYDMARQVHLNPRVARMAQNIDTTKFLQRLAPVADTAIPGLMEVSARTLFGNGRNRQNALQRVLDEDYSDLNDQQIKRLERFGDTVLATSPEDFVRHPTEQVRVRPGRSRPQVP